MRMKNFVIILTVLIFGVSSLALAQPKSPVEESLAGFDKMMALIKVSSVIGEPIQSGETVILPFARISFGLGGGGAMMGFGAGMGGKVIPAGFLIIEGESIKVELLPVEEKKPSFLQEMLPTLLKLLPQMQGKSPSSPKPKAPEKTGKPEGAKSVDEVKKLFEEKNYSEALAGIDSLLAANPNDSELHAWKGQIMGRLAQGNPLDMMKYGMGAMQEFNKAVELDSTNVRARFGRGIGRLMAPQGFGKNLEGAIEDLEYACSKQPLPEACYYLGQAYQQKGLLDKAKEAYKKALTLRADYPEAAKALAEIK